jgi:hypothetical protein
MAGREANERRVRDLKRTIRRLGEGVELEQARRELAAAREALDDDLRDGYAAQRRTGQRPT